MTRCDDCHTDLTNNEWFCTHCGKPRTECPQCSSTMSKTEEHCSTCGTVRMAPCNDCGRDIEVTADECPHCNYMPGRTRKRVGMGIAVTSAVLGLGIPGYILATQDGILATIGAIVLAIILLPIAGVMFLGGGGLMYTGETADPASVSAGKRQYKSDPLRVDISDPNAPSACPNCGQSWEKKRFGEIVERIGYDEFQENRFQCKNCDHIEQIL